MPGYETLMSDVLMTVAGLVLLMLIGMLGAALKWIQAHTSAKTFELMTAIGRAAVKATAQVAKTRGWTNADKYADAKDRIEALATAHGLKLTEAQINTLVERAVRELKTLDATFLGPPTEYLADVAEGSVNV